MHTGSRWRVLDDSTLRSETLCELRLQLSSEPPVHGTTNLLFDEVRIHAYKTPKSDNIGTIFILGFYI